MNFVCSANRHYVRSLFLLLCPGILLPLWIPAEVDQVVALEAKANFEIDPPYSVLGVSPDLRWMVTKDSTLADPGQFQIWSVDTGAIVRELGGQFAAFSPDGKSVFTSEMKNVYQYWSGEDGRELAHLFLSLDETLLSVSPDFGTGLVFSEGWEEGSFQYSLTLRSLKDNRIIRDESDILSLFQTLPLPDMQILDNRYAMIAGLANADRPGESLIVILDLHTGMEQYRRFLSDCQLVKIIPSKDEQFFFPGDRIVFFLAYLTGENRYGLVAFDAISGEEKYRYPFPFDIVPDFQNDDWKNLVSLLPDPKGVLIQSCGRTPEGVDQCQFVSVLDIETGIERVSFDFSFQKSGFLFNDETRVLVLEPDPTDYSCILFAYDLLNGAELYRLHLPDTSWVVDTLLLSPSGETAVLISSSTNSWNEKFITLVDLNTGGVIERIDNLIFPSRLMNPVSYYGDDGQYILCQLSNELSSQTGSYLVIESKTGREIVETEGYFPIISEDGQYLLLQEEDPETGMYYTVVRSTDSKETLHRFEGMPLAISPDNSTVMTLSEGIMLFDWKVLFWRMSDNQVGTQCENAFGIRMILAAWFYENSHTAVFLFHTREIVFWDVETHSKIISSPSFESLTTYSLAENKTLIEISSYPGSLVFWDQTQKTIQWITDCFSSDFHIHSDRHWFRTFSTQSVLSRSDMDSWEKKELNTTGFSTTSISLYSSDNAILIEHYIDGKKAIIDTMTGDILARPRITWIIPGSYRKDRVLSEGSSEEGTIQLELRNARTGEIEKTFSIQGDGIFSPDNPPYVLSRNGRFLAILDYFSDLGDPAMPGEYTLHLWDLDTQRVMASRTFSFEEINNAGVIKIAVSDNGKYLLISLFGIPALWDVERNQLEFIFDYPLNYGVGFTPHGLFMYFDSYWTETGSGTLFMRPEDLSTGYLMPDIDAMNRQCWDFYFSADGNSLLTVGMGNTVKLWDISNSTAVHDFMLY